MTNRFAQVIGIDEAGRGPVAGPAVLGLVAADKNGCRRLRERLKKIGFPFGKDSKKMTEKEREFWFGVLRNLRKEKLLDFRVEFSSNKVIDKKGISNALSVCVRRGLRGLKAPADSRVLLDGALSAPSRYIYQKSIIKGDEKEWLISLASVAAKVKRDKFMKKLASVLPAYAFEKHKGYGTREHYRILSACGISAAHRVTFLRK